MKLRAIVVDDEPIARLRIRRLLDAESNVELIAECADGEAAVVAICREGPELVFLDIQMPEMDGFEVVKQVGVERMPVTIFVTAHDQYALRAFEAHALDYLLKPFGKARFTEALNRAKQHVAGLHNSETIKRVLESLGQAANRYPEKIPVTESGRIVFINTSTIDWIDANGNYARLHVGNQQYDIRETLVSIEHRLDPLEFLRIHRSTIVNVRSIKEIHPWFRGHHLVVLNNGQELRMSRYQHEVARRLGVRHF
ncbi:MAG TPA: LytTR family DNA-binding domain-containing protein [Steroidobacteraceae bacterium]|jgi:two-component system LytT family response regulator|nr:LytTR family DNA-binding domain-containing protein [Steroidobacteraceae bacterium]